MYQSFKKKRNIMMMVMEMKTYKKQILLILVLSVTNGIADLENQPHGGIKTIDDLLIEWGVPNSNDDISIISADSEDLLLARPKRWSQSLWLPGPRGVLCIADSENTDFSLTDTCRCQLCRAPKIMRNPCVCSADGVVLQGIDCVFPPKHGFMNATNKCTEAYPCTVCEKPLITKRPCHPDTDTQCDCRDGTYRSGDVKCTEYPRCSTGTGLTHQYEGGSSYPIYKCNACDEGMVQTKNNSSTVCRKHKIVQCSQSGWRLIPGNRTHDPFCVRAKNVETTTMSKQTTEQQKSGASEKDQVQGETASNTPPMHSTRDVHTTGQSEDQTSNDEKDKESLCDKCICRRSPNLPEDNSTIHPLAVLLIGIFIGFISGCILSFWVYKKYVEPNHN